MGSARDIPWSLHRGSQCLPKARPYRPSQGGTTGAPEQRPGGSPLEAQPSHLCPPAERQNTLDWYGMKAECFRLRRLESRIL